MNPLAKRREIAKAKQYILDHPGCTYEELNKALGIQSLSKPYFFNIRGTLRKQGKIPIGEKPHGPKAGGKVNVKSKVKNAGLSSGLTSTTVEILYSMDASALTPELRELWKAHVLPLLQTLLPNGEKIKFAFLVDPPVLEIRKEIF